MSQFRAYGKLEGDVANPVASNPKTYTGREDDGTGLMNYRARYYNPELEGFISDDPLGDAQRYVGGNPLSLVDPLGLRPLNSYEKSILTSYISQQALNNADVHVGEMPGYTYNWVAGITLGNDIYIRDAKQTFTTASGFALLGHELVHVDQYSNGMTLLNYLWESRNGYEQNSYEKQAYALDKKIFQDLFNKYGNKQIPYMGVKKPCFSK